MNESISQQFKFIGLTAINFSIIFGIFLITWGILITYISNSNSLTSMIPSFLGIPILCFSLIYTFLIKSVNNV